MRSMAENLEAIASGTVIGAEYHLLRFWRRSDVAQR
jgi:hypothetical protein